MEGGRTPGSSLGPCPECGEPLPVGTQRYCVHCGAEVVPVGGTPSWFDAASATRPAPITPSPRPGASRRPTTWSSGDYRAPSPTDAEGLAIPPVPAGDEEWNGPVSGLIRTVEQAVPSEGGPEGTGSVGSPGVGSPGGGMPVAPSPAGLDAGRPVAPPPAGPDAGIAVPPLPRGHRCRPGRAVPLPTPPSTPAPARVARTTRRRRTR